MKVWNISVGSKECGRDTNSQWWRWVGYFFTEVSRRHGILFSSLEPLIKALLSLDPCKGQGHGCPRKGQAPNQGTPWITLALPTCKWELPGVLHCPPNRREPSSLLQVRVATIPHSEGSRKTYNPHTWCAQAPGARGMQILLQTLVTTKSNVLRGANSHKN